MESGVNNRRRVVKQIQELTLEEHDGADDNIFAARQRNTGAEGEGSLVSDSWWVNRVGDVKHCTTVPYVK